MSNTDRPYLGEYLDLTYSEEAAAGLSATNGLVQQLRALPEKLLTPALRNDRDRVLDKALPDLLAAHRDARVAGTDSADAELAAGLEHIRVEVTRIVTACRSDAGDTLAIQGRYLEQVYPVVGDNPLALSLGDSGVEKLVGPSGADSRRKLDRQSLEALFHAPAGGTTTSEGRAAPQTWRSRLVQIGWAITAPVVVLLIPVLTIWGLLYGFVKLYEHNKTPDPTFRPDRVELTAMIARVRRSTIPDAYHVSGSRVPAAMIELRGTVRNLARDHPLLRQAVRVDLYSCSNNQKPLKQCAWITSSELDVTDDRVQPGVAARWNRQERLQMPDVTGILRAIVYPDASIFDDTPLP